VLEQGTRGRFLPNGSVSFRRQMQIFFFECLSSPSVALGEDGLPRVPCFPECHALFNARERLPSPSATLGEDWLPRVPDIWYSGNLASPVVWGLDSREEVESRGRNQVLCFPSLSSLTMLPCHQFADVSSHLFWMDSILRGPLGLPLESRNWWLCCQLYTYHTK
jgi:hypothetical protein